MTNSTSPASHAIIDLTPTDVYDKTKSQAIAADLRQMLKAAYELVSDFEVTLDEYGTGPKEEVHLGMAQRDMIRVLAALEAGFSIY